MLHKLVKFQYIPLERVSVGDQELYFYGERNNAYDETIVEGDINNGKFVTYYLRNGIV